MSMMRINVKEFQFTLTREGPMLVTMSQSPSTSGVCIFIYNVK